jgi:hypothetical protein
MTEPPVTQLTEKSNKYPGYNKWLLLMLALGNMALFAVYAGINGILDPSIVQDVDPANKVANLGLVPGSAPSLQPSSILWAAPCRTGHVPAGGNGPLGS